VVDLCMGRDAIAVGARPANERSTAQPRARLPHHHAHSRRCASTSRVRGSIRSAAQTWHQLLGHALSRLHSLILEVVARVLLVFAGACNTGSAAVQAAPLQPQAPRG